MLTGQTIGEEGLAVREANHRMLNMLTTLQAGLHHKFARFSEQSVRSAMTEFEGQIIAAAELFRVISTLPAAGDIDVDVFLQSLGRALSKAILSPAGIRCQTSSDRGQLPVDVCGRLGFIVVELVLNASKYAFAGRNNRFVRIEMKQSVGQWRCTVSDNGIGMDDTSAGTGLRIVKELAQSVNGSLVLRSGTSGTCVSVVLPELMAALS